MSKKAKTKKGKKQQTRKLQSIQDKQDAFWKLGKQLSDPLGEYREFLADIRMNGFNANEFAHIPINLIDLTATLIAALLTGRDIFPVFLSLQPSVNSKIHHSQKHFLKTSKNRSFNTKSSPSDIKSTETVTNPEETTYSFIRKIIKRTRLSLSTFLLGLLFIFRLRHMKTRKGKRFTGNSAEGLTNSVNVVSTSSESKSGSPKNSKNSTGNTKSSKVDGESPVPTFIASVICADKILYDSTFTNQDWVEFTDGSYNLDQINQIERDFLRRLDYNLFVTDKEFEYFLSYLDIMIFFRQMYRWSSLTYRDLLRLSINISPEFLDRRLSGSLFFPRNSTSTDLRAKYLTTPSDAIMLLVRIMIRQVVGYVATFAVAAAIVGVVVQNVATGIVVNAQIIASLNLTTSNSTRTDEILKTDITKLSLSFQHLNRKLHLKSEDEYIWRS